MVVVGERIKAGLLVLQTVLPFKRGTHFTAKKVQWQQQEQWKVPSGWLTDQLLYASSFLT